MGILRPGDERMHYHDSSHRWVSPDPDDDQEAWEDRIREHQRQHRENLGPKRANRQQSFSRQDPSGCQSGQ
jgi:hypothetical protein